MKQWMLGLALLAPMAQAAIITIEPDDYAAGFDVSRAVPGVTITNIFQDPGGPHGDRPVLIREEGHCPGVDCRAYTGSHTFGWYGMAVGWRLGDESYGYNLLQITFDNPVKNFSVTTTFGSDPIELYFNGSQCTVSYLGNGPCTYDVERREGIQEVSYRAGTVHAHGTLDSIIIGGSSGASVIDAVAFEWLDPAFNPVPEPATLALLGIGLAGLVAARRKT